MSKLPAASTVIEPTEDISSLPFSAIDYLANIDGREVDKNRRIQITQSCHDADYIPKVKNAGKVFNEGSDKAYQLMHNGLKVQIDGYYGSWVTDLITSLKGHHEPQEEKVFYELSKLFRPNTHMIELGSYWSYYSLWFHQVVPGAYNICCEPDPRNKEIGQANFKLNGFKDVTFVDAAAGRDDGKIISFDAEHVEDLVSVPIRSVDSLVNEYDIQQLELLHMDVQGAEYDALQGAVESIKAGKVRFLFISTHHYLISRDPNIHQKCIDMITDLGGHIICDHDIHESFSGDGLIVASFLPEDKELKVEISANRMVGNQFRAYTKDLELVFQAYEAQLHRIKNKNIRLADVGSLEGKVKELEKDIHHLNNLNVPVAFKFFLKSIKRSLKYHTIRLIWGNGTGYKNTERLEALYTANVTTKSDAKEVLEAINEADRVNNSLVSRQESRLRRALYEGLRSSYRAVRRLLKRSK